MKKDKRVIEISKKMFTEGMGVIEYQMTHDSKYADALSKVFKCYVDLYDSHMPVTFICDIFIAALEPNVKDRGDSIIDYFIYELEFGKKYKDGCYLVNKKPVDISTVEKLYDHLVG
jgi:hypothetical protein